MSSVINHRSIQHFEQNLSFPWRKFFSPLSSWTSQGVIENRPCHLQQGLNHANRSCACFNLHTTMRQLFCFLPQTSERHLLMVTDFRIQQTFSLTGQLQSLTGLFDLLTGLLEALTAQLLSNNCWHSEGTILKKCPFWRNNQSFTLFNITTTLLISVAMMVSPKRNNRKFPKSCHRKRLTVRCFA